MSLSYFIPPVVVIILSEHTMVKGLKSFVSKFLEEALSVAGIETNLGFGNELATCYEFFASFLGHNDLLKLWLLESLGDLSLVVS